MWADLLNWVESTCKWPATLVEGYVSPMPKGEGSGPLQLRHLPVLSAIYGAWSGQRLKDSLQLQEKWVYKKAFAF